MIKNEFIKSKKEDKKREKKSRKKRKRGPKGVLFFLKKKTPEMRPKIDFSHKNSQEKS